jgi:diguanylate cyclase (GGDEF)-like protein
MVRLSRSLSRLPTDSVFLSSRTSPRTHVEAPPGLDHQYDALTGVYNQGAFQDDLRRATSGSLSVAAPIACVRIDIDDFKGINDTNGHAAGDATLRQLAGLLRRKVRERDRVYRVGGDEFAVLFMDFSEEEAFGVMRRVSEMLRGAPVRWIRSDGGAIEFPVTISVGVAECAHVGEISRAFEDADKAAYASKRAGKATITRASSLPAADVG